MIKSHKIIAGSPKTVVFGGFAEMCHHCFTSTLAITFSFLFTSKYDNPGIGTMQSYWASAKHTCPK